MRNKDDLLHWYKQQAALNKKVAKRHLRFLFVKIWFYWFLLGILFLLVATFVTVQYLEYRQVVKTEKAHGLSRRGYTLLLRENLVEKINLSLVEITALLCFFAATFFVYLSAKEAVCRFQIMKTKKKVLPFSTCNSDLMGIIEEVAFKMNISVERIFVWKSFSLQPFPSIEEGNDKTFHLLIPPSFHAYARKYPQKAASVIAHEFGHVLQSDTKLYLLCEAYVGTIRTIFLPVLMSGLLVQVYLFWKLNIDLKTAPEMLLSFLPALFLFGITLYDFKSLKRARRRSEEMADMAAILFLGNDSLLDVLREMKGRPGLPSSFRKNLDLRIANIQRVVAISGITFSGTR